MKKAAPVKESGLVQQGQSSPKELRRAIATARPPVYRSPVAAKSANGFGDPSSYRRTGAPITIAGAFFVPAFRLMVAVRGRPSGLPGSCMPGSPTRAQLPPLNRLATIRGSSSHTGAPPMKTQHALIPSNIRALAHRRMALAALHANSSLSTRLKRYNHHIEIARTLEAQGGVQ